MEFFWVPGNTKDSKTKLTHVVQDLMKGTYFLPPFTNTSNQPYQVQFLNINQTTPTELPRNLPLHCQAAKFHLDVKVLFPRISFPGSTL